MNEVLAAEGLFDPNEWGVSVAATFGYRARDITKKNLVDQLKKSLLRLNNLFSINGQQTLPFLYPPNKAAPPVIASIVPYNKLSAKDHNCARNAFDHGLTFWLGTS